MPAERFVFFDFDDTLSDFAELGRQYVGELAQLLTSDFGGSVEQWAAAVQPSLRESIARYEERFIGNPLAGYGEWIQLERAHVVKTVFERAGAPLPEREPASELGRRLQFDALVCCRAAFPGAAEALNTLFERDVRAQMASSQESDYLLAALMGAGLESYIESKFGPDLVDCAKEGPEFYARVFDAAQVDPAAALVIDDQVQCLRWAREAGATVVQAKLCPRSPDAQFENVLTAFSDLPALVDRLLPP